LSSNDDSSCKPITELLSQWRRGDDEALNQLMPLVQAELKAIARRRLQAERPDHTLQSTALVNEAYLRLVNADVDWKDRVHFFAMAARIMRHILVDYARAQKRDKRGGEWTRLSLDDAPVAFPHAASDILHLDDALKKLSAFDDRKGQVIELTFFGGLTYDETAEALQISTATVHRELRLAKAWLFRELAPGNA
jgi:RNA polymerase sigma factor (TIGR02999 family)